MISSLVKDLKIVTIDNFHVKKVFFLGTYALKGKKTRKRSLVPRIKNPRGVT